eukprot:GHVR01107491.1.p2 GENE.GHVR01107491.1~~GHVR01107491.1.p2  ORF type:complete len:178 (+),score=56.80 GHVR01107491.1:859-1392(+)
MNHMYDAPPSYPAIDHQLSFLPPPPSYNYNPLMSYTHTPTQMAQLNNQNMRRNMFINPPPLFSTDERQSVHSLERSDQTSPHHFLQQATQGVHGVNGDGSMLCLSGSDVSPMHPSLSIPVRTPEHGGGKHTLTAASPLAQPPTPGMGVGRTNTPGRDEGDLCQSVSQRRSISLAFDQ